MKRVVLDTDVGLDDAEAIIYLSASKNVQLEAVTLVSGNASTEVISDNVKRVLKYLRQSAVPVYDGGSYNLLGKYIKSDGYFGENAFANITLPKADFESQTHMKAAEALIHYARKYPGEIHFVFIGPLTNLALAFLLDNEFPSFVGSITVMGGDVSETTVNNVSPFAEFNFYCDPLAVRIVTECFRNKLKLPINLVDWHSCRNSLLPYRLFDELFDADGSKKKSNIHVELFSILRDKTNEIVARSFWKDGFLTADLFSAVYVDDQSIAVSTKRIDIASVVLEGEKAGHITVQDAPDGLYQLIITFNPDKVADKVVKVLQEA